MNILLCLFCLGLISLGHGICPEVCDCSLDEWGRRQVACVKGGLKDPIPIASMDQNVEVLKISAPIDSPNFLTIGPIFQKFSHLEQLDIVESNIPAIGKHSFWGVPTLRMLNLSRNNISHISDYNFRGLVKLVELNLEDNRIESMPSETFRHLQELNVLNLSGNRIRELVPRIFIMLSKLKELDLSRNPLFDLNPEVFKDVQNLRKLKCRSCSLSNVNKLIYQLLPDLIELDLGHNEFKYVLPEEFHGLRKLSSLRLDGNQLTVITDNTFGSVRPKSTGSHLDERVEASLDRIDLSRNRLAKITVGAFANLSTLRTLDLSYNKLDNMESGVFFPMVSSLMALNLSGNAVPMDELKFIIQILVRLTHLSLSEMRLSDLPPGLFAYHENLRYLDLSGNRFSHLSPHITVSLTRIHTLNLSRNYFRGLTEKIIVRLEKIPNLVLEGNPWACDLCHIPPILNRVNNSQAVSGFRQLTCRSPRGLAGRTIFSLRGDELRWCSSNEISDFGYDENSELVGVPGSLLPSEARTGLVLALVALSVFLVLGIVLVACIVHSRRRTDHYYTREESRGQTEHLFDDSIRNENGNGVHANGNGDLPRLKRKKVTIATIDEIVKYPELQVLTNGT